MLSLKYRGKFDTAWNLSRWKALLETRVEGRVGGFFIQKFLPCSLPRKDLCFFSMLSVSTFGNEQIPFSVLFFFWGGGKFLTPMAWPSSRERQIYMDMRRELLKPLQTAVSQKVKKKQSQRTLRTRRGSLNVMVSLMELWSLVFPAAKPNAVCVHVQLAHFLLHWQARRSRFLIVPWNFGIQAGIHSS